LLVKEQELGRASEALMGHVPPDPDQLEDSTVACAT
jgi:hypothetical protein